MAIDLDEYFRQQAARTPPYGGQLSAEFQAALHAWHTNVTAAECEFYHTVELPDGRVFPGQWDLRGQENIFLGGQRLSRKRVIEYGPASGALSAHMAKQGAELTVFELPFGAASDIMPIEGVDFEASKQGGVETLERVHKSWWFLKRELGFAARAVYGDIYDQPDDLGDYEVSVMSLILLHLSNPFRALQMAAARTRETIIITEMQMLPESVLQLSAQPGNELPLGVFGPSPAPAGVVHWWAFSPAALRHMLRRLGFSEISTMSHPGRPLFTIVAHRA
jgi:hypothetical protein